MNDGIMLGIPRCEDTEDIPDVDSDYEDDCPNCGAVTKLTSIGVAPLNGKRKGWSRLRVVEECSKCAYDAIYRLAFPDTGTPASHI